MTKEEFNDRIEMLVMEYFDENEDETEISDCYTLQYKGDDVCYSIDYDFDRR